jgi:FkbM family methyltransferase
MLRSTAFFVQRFVFGRNTLMARVPRFNLELRVASNDAAGRHLYKRGMHAPAVSNFLATGLALEPGDVVFDIGASIGWYSLLLARIAPPGVAIHAFEPDPWARGLLQENVNRNRAARLTVSGSAVGDCSGVATLRLHDHRRGSWHRLMPLNETLEVEMVSLDDYCSRTGLASRPVGFIKLGVEGFEVLALRGAVKTLKRCRAILTEFAPARLRRADTHPLGLLDLMVELGFAPAVLEAGGPRPVERAELAADERRRHVLWTRPQASVPRQQPDPGVLAI